MIPQPLTPAGTQSPTPGCHKTLTKTGRERVGPGRDGTRTDRTEQGRNWDGIVQGNNCENASKGTQKLAVNLTGSSNMDSGVYENGLQLSFGFYN